MLEEIGVDYEQIPIDWSQGESRTPDFLTINPNGKVPVLEDGEFRLFESLAINYYLASNYAAHMWVDNNRDQSLASQWLAWGMGELEGPHDAANRDKSDIDLERLQVSLSVMRQAIAEQPYILGETFSVVDLNTACLLLRPQYRRVAYDDNALGDWFRACTSRPSLKSATAKNGK